MVLKRIPHWFQCGIFSISLLAILFPGGQLTAQGIAGTTTLPKQKPSKATLSPTGNYSILALRVAFEPDVRLGTTGTGQFLTPLDEPLCDGFIVDPPPHNTAYFYDQLLAVGNYFDDVSSGNLTIDLVGSLVYPSEGAEPIGIASMASYRPAADEDSSNGLLVQLAVDAIAEAVTGGVNVAAYDVVVIFHAGLGQDFAYDGLDPTPLDIPSTFVDEQMILDALDTSGIPYGDNQLLTAPIVMLPESQNHIFYDVVKDIFFSTDDYCEAQLGLTGTFALLLGYAFGLPPLYNSVDGETAVGVFGLMDVGSNNGRGVIPAPPTAWTRIYARWETSEILDGNTSLIMRHDDSATIGRIDLSTSEHLLIENRVNWIDTAQVGVSIDSLRWRAREGDIPARYFETLTQHDMVAVNTATGVITSASSYDLGLPGSGLLIWHIDETRYTDEMLGLNDDPKARAIRLVEADGAIDIGFPTTDILARPQQGWGFDFWYAGNEGFFFANPTLATSNLNEPLQFNDNTRPPLVLNSGAAADVAIEDIGSAGFSQSFTVTNVGDLTIYPAGTSLHTFDGTNLIYTRNDSLFRGMVALGTASTENIVAVVSERDPADGDPGDGLWLVKNSNGSYTANRYDQVGLTYTFTAPYDVSDAWYTNGKLHLRVSARYPEPPDTSLIVYGDFRSVGMAKLIKEDNYSYMRGIGEGDLDGNGIEESIILDDIRDDTILYAWAQSNFVLDGFPIYGNFQDIALTGNLLGDALPEIVTVISNDIVILGPEGDELDAYGLRTDPQRIFLFKDDSGRTGLANGDRVHWFSPDTDNLQWVTEWGNYSRSNASLFDGTIHAAQPVVLDKSRVYNYPNPVIGNFTTIRFYVGTATNATIKIYTVDGHVVEDIKVESLTNNSYNEWRWHVADIQSGLYYAVVEVNGATTESTLIKIAVVK